MEVLPSQHCRRPACSDGVVEIAIAGKPGSYKGDV